MKHTLKVTTPSDLEIVMTRTFNAPRPLVWQAMTKPELIRQWLYAPEGWSMSVCEGEAKIGRPFRWAWNGPDGKLAMTISGVYREVVAPERIVHTETMEMGGTGACSTSADAEAGELVATLVLTEKDGATTLRMTLVFPSKEARDGALASGMESGVSIGYDRLDEILASRLSGSEGARGEPPKATKERALRITTPTDRELVLSREFNAPRSLVFNAWTRPELLTRWMTGPQWSLAVCEMNFRIGGAIRWIWQGGDGREIGLRGVYREIVAPERIVHTELYDEDWTGGETLVTLGFDERDGKTTVTMTILYSSREARDGALKVGMEDGMEASYDQLERLLAEPQLDEPQVVQSNAQQTAAIRLSITRDEIRQAFPQAIKELMGALAAQGIAPAGPVFAHYFNCSDKLDFEVGVPVSQQVAPSGRVKPSELPAATVARTVYTGSYEGLHSAWAKFGEWTAGHGHKRGPTFWESYVQGPESNQNPSTWRTELSQVISK